MKTNPNNFLKNILTFVDQNGVVIDKRSTPVLSSLQMKFENKKLKAKIYVYCHCMGNGYCEATVFYDDKLVFKGNGNFLANPFNCKIEEYKTGKWEKMMNF